MFKDFLDYKDPKKGYIVNDSFNNPTILDVGFHQYKNVYNFYNNAKAGQIGAVKSIVNQNNNILWTPNQGNNVEMNLTQTSSSTSTNPDNFLPVDIGVDYDSYLENTYTATAYFPISNPCSCSPSTFSVPVAIEIVDYNLNGKIPFVFIGVKKNTTYYKEAYCSHTNSNISFAYNIIDYYLITSAGNIPAPLIFVHLGRYLGNCPYFVPTPGTINYNYITWTEYCQLKKNNPDFLNIYFGLDIFELKNSINGCNSSYFGPCNEQVWYWEGGAFVHSGEYVKVRTYYKTMSNICV
jgi:hypothetical protein